MKYVGTCLQANVVTLQLCLPCGFNVDIGSGTAKSIGGEILFLRSYFNLTENERSVFFFFWSYTVTWW